ncbi:MAG: GatB/YqeY domain-containing protein [Fibrobacterales bacterium]
MSALLNRVLADVKQSMKDRNKDKLALLRTLHSDIKNISINNNIDICDDVVIDAIQKTIKQKNDGIEMFKKGERADLVEKEEASVIILKTYLPDALSQAELMAIVGETIEEVGAEDKKDFGKVMKAVQPKIKGRADNKAVSSIIQSILN